MFLKEKHYVGCIVFHKHKSLVQANYLKDLLKNVSVDSILSFLRNVNFFNKISIFYYNIMLINFIFEYIYIEHFKILHVYSQDPYSF